jgi:hypothetical protein
MTAFLSNEDDSTKTNMQTSQDAHYALIQADRIRAEAEAIRLRDGENAAQVYLIQASAIELDARNALEIRSETAVSVGGERLDPRDNSTAATKQPRSPSKVTTTAAVERLNMIHNNGVFDLALDAAESVGATTALEKMITHELAAAHKTAMDLLERCKQQGDPTGEIKSINAAARLMVVVQQGALALQRLKTGGNQVMTVQHVTIAAGGQAVIGNVKGGSASRIVGDGD